MRPMTVWTPTDNERQSILHLHNKPYDGYAVLQNPSNTYPLTTMDYRLDQQGMTLNNKGEIKGHSNFGINESINETFGYINLMVKMFFDSVIVIESFEYIFDIIYCFIIYCKIFNIKNFIIFLFSLF